MKKLTLTSPLKLNKETVAKLGEVRVQNSNKMVTFQSRSCGDQCDTCVEQGTWSMC